MSKWLIYNLQFTAKQAAQDEAGNLENELLLSVGAKVMLLWNLCIDEGLANGTRATVHSIIWDDDVQDVFSTMPALVLVKIDDYRTGECSYQWGASHFYTI